MLASYHHGRCPLPPVQPEEDELPTYNSITGVSPLAETASYSSYEKDTSLSLPTDSDLVSICGDHDVSDAAVKVFEELSIPLGFMQTVTIRLDTVKVVSRKLIQSSRCHHKNLYCILFINSKKVATTRVVREDGSTEWDEKFDLSVSSHEVFDLKIVVKVMEKRKLLADRLVAMATVLDMGSEALPDGKVRAHSTVKTVRLTSCQGYCQQPHERKNVKYDRGELSMRWVLGAPKVHAQLFTMAYSPRNRRYRFFCANEKTPVFRTDGVWPNLMLVGLDSDKDLVAVRRLQLNDRRNPRFELHLATYPRIMQVVVTCETILFTLDGREYEGRRKSMDRTTASESFEIRDVTNGLSVMTFSRNPMRNYHHWNISIWPNRHFLHLMVVPIIVDCLMAKF
eukprot:Clim_evm38s77 gene=Clim_evmTU38s77